MDELIGELRELCAIEGRPLTVGERARTKIAMSEAAAALEAAREDAAEAKQNGYELGLLAAAREDACPTPPAPGHEREGRDG